ncbi:MAG: hypothetical protein V1649_00970 [Patescibacteria group bacterium]
MKNLPKFGNCFRSLLSNKSNRFMKKLLAIISCWCVIGVFVLLILSPVLATETIAAETPFNKGLGATAGQTGHASLSTIWKLGNLPNAIGTVIKAGLALLGVAFLGLIIYAGFIWMLARGNEQDITKARDLIISAIIGLIIILGAYAITVAVSVFAR